MFGIFPEDPLTANFRDNIVYILMLGTKKQPVSRKSNSPKPVQIFLKLPCLKLSPLSSDSKIPDPKAFYRHLFLHYSIISFLISYRTKEAANSLVGIATCLLAGSQQNCASVPCSGKRYFCTKATIPAVGWNWPPIEWVQGDILCDCVTLLCI